MTELVELWRFREVLLNLVRRNLKVRYKNSFLGFFWSLLNPLLQIGVWWFVFGLLMPNPERNYMFVLITGFLPWLFFSQTVLDSTACVTQEMAIVKKAYFPRSLLPLSALISNLVHLSLAFVVLLVLFAVRGTAFTAWFWAHAWLVIPSTLLVAVFAYGLSAMLAAWAVLYADVKFIVGNLLGLWFFLTPVLYSISGFLLKTGLSGEQNWLRSVIQAGLPWIKRVYLADPVTVGILGYRSALLGGGENPIEVHATSGTSFADVQRLFESHGLSTGSAQSLWGQLARHLPHGLTPDQAATLQSHLRAEYPFCHYVLAAAVIAIITAIVGHIVFKRLARQFAEKG